MMSNLLKKFVFSFLSSLILLFSFAPYFAVSAQTPAPTGGDTADQSTWYSPSLFDFYTKVFDKTNPSEIFGERYTYAQVVWILESLPLAILGITSSTFQDLLQQVQANPTGFDIEKSNIAKVKDFSLIAINQFYLSPPASGVYWLHEKINDLSIVKTAYAAPTNGFGYSSLKVFQPLWAASRNIAYTLMIVIALVVAFAVMFRLKISPQVVVTIQSAIPSFVVTLIVVTFSYAIVGFLVDLMYLVFGAIVYGINQAGGIASTLKVADLFNNFVSGGLISGAGVVGFVVIATGLIVLSIVTGGALLPFVIGLVVAVAIFFIKTFIMLAQTYLSLIINLVFGPIIILAEAIPFIKASAIGWFRSVLADILVFLMVGLLFLGQSLINGALDNANGAIVWNPPYLNFSPLVFKIMIWVGVWSMLPNIRNMVYRMMEKTAAEIQLPREFQGQGESFQRGLSTLTSREGFGGRLRSFFTPGAGRLPNP